MEIGSSLCWTVKLWGGPLHLLETSCAINGLGDNTVDLGLELSR